MALSAALPKSLMARAGTEMQLLPGSSDSDPEFQAEKKAEGPSEPKARTGRVP